MSSVQPSRKKPKGLTFTQLEPSMVRGVVVSILGLLATLGFGWASDVDAETVATIATVVIALAPILQALWTRYAVTANAKVVSRVTTEGDVVAGDAAAVPTGQVIDVVGDSPPQVAPVPVVKELVGTVL